MPSTTGFIPYGRQHIDDADCEAVLEVLRSDWLTQGPVIDQFEKKIAETCGARHAVAVCNGTAALHAACLASGLGEGDWLWTSPNTFVASANCGLYCGARVDFVDIDPRTLNMSVAALEEKLKEASRKGQLPKAVIPVHFAGEPCEMERIYALSKQYGFQVIEDGSHAVGATYRGNAVGSCAHSQMTTLSLHPVKIITSGEGGLILTNDDKLQEKLARVRTHGITRDPKLLGAHADEPWYYEQIELGYNFRITDVQAALGLSQLKRISTFLRRRHEIAQRYDKLFEGAELIKRPVRASDAYSALHLYVVRVPAEIRKNVFNKLRAANIGVNVHYIPVHLQPYYQKRFGFKEGQFPEAERYYSEALSLPMYATLRDDQVNYVVEQVKKAVSECAS